jgi:hypothetical protein
MKPTTKRERLERALATKTMTAELLREFTIAFVACERGEPSPGLIKMTRLPDDHPDALGWEDRARRAGLIVDEDAASPRPQKRSNQPARGSHDVS